MWFVWRWLWLLFLAVSSAPGCNRTAPPCWRTPSLSRSCPGSRTLHRTHLQRGVTQMCLHECWCMLPLLCNNGSRYSACVEKRETWIMERLEVCDVWINVQVVSQWGFSPASRCSWEIYQYYKISDIVTSWYGQSVVLSLFQRVHYSKVLSQTKESLIPTIRKMLDWHIPNGRCRTTLQSNVIRSMTPIFLSQHHRSVPRIKSNDSQVYFWDLCSMCVRCVCRPTLVEAYDVRVPEGGGDLDLSLDVNPVQVVCDALLADRLDRHLRGEGKLSNLR